LTVSAQVNEETADEDVEPSMLFRKRGIVRKVTIRGRDKKDDVYALSVFFFESFDKKTFQHVVSEIEPF